MTIGEKFKQLLHMVKLWRLIVQLQRCKSTEVVPYGRSWRWYSQVNGVPYFLLACVVSLTTFLLLFSFNCSWVYALSAVSLAAKGKVIGENKTCTRVCALQQTWLLIIWLIGLSEATLEVVQNVFILSSCGTHGFCMCLCQTYVHMYHFICQWLT